MVDAVHADDLLLDELRPAGQDTGLGRGGTPRLVQEALHRDALLAELLTQPAPWLVVADHAREEDLGAERADIDAGVGGAAGDSELVRVREDENGGLARD